MSIHVGAIVAVKPGTSHYYPGGVEIPAWVISEYNYEVKETISGGNPVVKGGKVCVLLGNKINKKTNQVEPGINSWIEEDAIVLISNGGGGGPYDTYLVKKGDTLWNIAAAKLGSGSRYPEIQALNGLTSDRIEAGQTLKIPKK